MSRGRTPPPHPLTTGRIYRRSFREKRFFFAKTASLNSGTVNCNHKIFDWKLLNAMVAHPRLKQAYPGNGGECWSLRCSHWSVILYDWSHGVSPRRIKALTGVLEVRSEALDALTGKRCEHTGWQNRTVGWRSNPPPPTPSPLAPTPSPPPPTSMLCYALEGWYGPWNLLRYPFIVTHGLDYFGPQRALAYWLDAISQVRKNSWFPVPNLLPLAFIMYLHASKTLRTGPYKS
jgi:hypothetical protein